MGSCEEKLRGALKNLAVGWFMVGAFLAIAATTFLVIGLLEESNFALVSIPFWIGSALMILMGVRSQQRNMPT